MDRRLGIAQPPGFPFNLNSAVDNLLKNEFDYYRSIQKPHPYIERLGLNAVPFQHESLDKWRHNFSGVTYQHKEWDYESRKCPKCKDGIIDESDEGMVVMAD